MNTPVVQATQTPRADRIIALYMGLTDTTTKPGHSIWLPIFRMTWDDEGYFYSSYTNAFQANYENLKGNIINPLCGYSQTWITRKLSSRISNRIPRRPDSMKHYALLGIGEQKGDLIAYLARSGGQVIGDNYDVFPQVTPDVSGWYNFYFPLSGLADKVKQGEETVKHFAQTAVESEPIILKSTFDTSYIYARGEEIGYCPHYIHHLLTSSVYLEHKLQIVKVNPDDYTYGRRIIVGIKLRFKSSPWQEKEFMPINPMPI